MSFPKRNATYEEGESVRVHEPTLPWIPTLFLSWNFTPIALLRYNLHNIKFTEMINKLHGTRLKLSPLNLSQSILVNKITYIKCIDNIYFDIEHDTNESINRWFEFILNMVDEQVYYSTARLSRIDDSKIDRTSNRAVDGSSMRLSRLR